MELKQGAEGGRHGGGTREYPVSSASSQPLREQISDELQPRGDREDRRDRDRGDRGDRNRRRSRSPQEYRGGSGARGPRREGGGEQDNYSSSRSHRDREREDRYSTRDRREREPWDRERGPRREPRRETDERRPQFNNAPRDGRHGVRRDRERGGDVDREKERQRSTTPPVKKREPTPDLTGVTSILERKRRMTQWDIKPPGYANVTAEQAKLSGMFPLPGAPRQQALDPTKMPTFMSQPGGGGGGGSSGVSNTVLRPTNSRQAKRLVVENLPPGTTDEELATFMNLQLNGLNVIESPDPCLACQVSVDKSFALAEFKSAPEATVALAFDGITMEADDQADENGASSGAGRGLTIRRPKDYIVPAIVDDAGYVPGVVSGMVIDTPNKLSVADIPTYLTDEQVTELLVSFGELKAFVLVKDRETEESRVSRWQQKPVLQRHIGGGEGVLISGRELHFANMSTQTQQTLLCRASTAWSSATRDSGSRRPASASHKSPVSRWASMPCPCLPEQRLWNRALPGSSSC